MRVLGLLLLIICAGCAARDNVTFPDPLEVQQEGGAIDETEEAPPILTYEDIIEAPYSGDFTEVAIAAQKPSIIDGTQRTVHNVVNATVRKVDSFFGQTELDRESRVSRGRISTGAQYDPRDGSKFRLRLKGRFALPAFEHRTRLMVGRGDFDDFIDGSADDNIDKLPNRFNDFEDEDWLIGVGYSRDQKLSRGWDFGVGVNVTFPLAPSIRATYRWNRSYGDDWLWRVSPRFFLQNQRGAGASLTNMLDHVFSETIMGRSYTLLVVEDEVEGVSWTQKFTAYQALSRNKAVSYSVYGTGETRRDVRVTNYGFELRFRRRILREWLFLELFTYVDWPREFPEEKRESNIGVGFEVEMQFGEWPDRITATTSAVK